jgi:hypothetical protein
MYTAHNADCKQPLLHVPTFTKCLDDRKYVSPVAVPRELCARDSSTVEAQPLSLGKAPRQTGATPSYTSTDNTHHAKHTTR